MQRNYRFGLKPEHHGVLNRDKTIYYISLGGSECGFFAIYRLLLELFYLADVCGMVPVVRYKKDFLYAESRMVHGTFNPYEYYFKQPVVGIMEARNSYNVVKATRLHNDMVELVFNGKYGVYEASPLYLKQMAGMQKKYIILKPETEKYIKEGIHKLIGEKNVLGVHIRGTDFKKNYDTHPKYIGVERFVDEIYNQLNNGRWDKVFLATDDLGILERCKNEFGDRLVFYRDVYRAGGGKSVAFSDDERSRHKYMLGLEVLRDAYTLAACNGLIAGISQVSICARIMKLSQNSHYRYMKILDEGYNANGKLFRVESVGKRKLQKKKRGNV